MSIYKTLSAVVFGKIVFLLLACFFTKNENLTACGIEGLALSKMPNLIQPTVQSVFVFIESKTDISCANPNAYIQAGANAGTAPYSFAWSSGHTGNPIYVSLEGTYTVTVTDAVGETASVAVTIYADLTPPGAGAVGDTITCAHPIAKVSVTSPTLGVSWYWFGPDGFTSTAQNLSVTQTGGYQVIVTNPANGCFSVASAFVMENTIKPGVAAVGGVISCVFDSVKVASNLWQSGLETAWAGPNGFSSFAPDFYVKEGGVGDYLVTVTDPVNGCSVKDTANVWVDKTPPGVSATATMITCQNHQGQVHGSSPTSGVGWLWKGPYFFNSNEQSPKVGLPGSYFVTVTSPINGCTSNSNIFVDSDNMSPGVALVGDKITCANDTIKLVGYTNTLGVSYTWSGPGGFFSNDANVFVHKPGDYTLVVTLDATGCTTFLNKNIEEDKSPPVAAISGGGLLTCAATIFPLMGSSPELFGVSYQWTGPNQFFSNDQNTWVGWKGNYTLTVTKASNGCTSTATYFLPADQEAPVLTVADLALNCINPFGIIKAIADPDGLTFFWMGPGGFSAFTNSIIPNAPGFYSVTVTNPANGCSSSGSMEFSVDFDQPLVSIQSVTLSCSAPTGNLVTTVSASTGVTYLWSGFELNPGDEPNPVVANPGVYSLTVTDAANGCMASASVEVVADVSVPSVSIANLTLNCANPTGKLLPILSPPPLPPFVFSWIWQGPGGFTSADFSPSVSVPGNYLLTLVDGMNGCTATATAVVSKVPDFEVEIVGEMPVDCFGGVAVNLAITGGTPPYQINPPNLTFAPGDWTIEVSDAGGCLAVSEYNVPFSVGPDLSLIIQDATQGLSDGSILLFDFLGMIEPLQFEWKNSAGQVVGTEAELLGVPAGDYTVQITDALGCVFNPPAITVKETVGAGEAILEKAIRLAPNPTSDFLEIAWPENAPTPAFFKMLDVNGRVVFTEAVPDFSKMIDLTRLPGGVYWVEILVENQRIWQKLVVQR